MSQFHFISSLARSVDYSIINQSHLSLTRMDQSQLTLNQPSS